MEAGRGSRRSLKERQGELAVMGAGLDLLSFRKLRRRGRKCPPSTQKGPTCSTCLWCCPPRGQDSKDPRAGVSPLPQLWMPGPLSPTGSPLPLQPTLEILHLLPGSWVTWALQLARDIAQGIERCLLFGPCGGVRCTHKTCHPVQLCTHRELGARTWGRRYEGRALLGVHHTQPKKGPTATCAWAPS